MCRPPDRWPLRRDTLGGRHHQTNWYFKPVLKPGLAGLHWKDFVWPVPVALPDFFRGSGPTFAAGSRGVRGGVAGRYLKPGLVLSHRATGSSIEGAAQQAAST